MIRLIAASHAQQTITLAQELVKKQNIIGAEGLDFIETILVYKLPHLRREEIKAMLALTHVSVK